MSDEYSCSISVSGDFTVRQRPSFLMLVQTLDASAATLELALSMLRQKREAAVQWLERLEAQNIEFGEPRFPEQAELDPLKMAHKAASASMAKFQQQTGATGASETQEKKVMVTLTALWPLEGMSSEEVLIFADRLQFEATDQTEPDAEKSADPDLLSADLEQQARAFMSALQSTDQANDHPQFLFVSRISEEQLEKALTKAFADARSSATSLANAAGRQLGGMKSIHSMRTHDSAAEVKRMHRRTYMPGLDETSHGSCNDEIVSESPRAAEFVVSINVTYQLK